MKLYEKARGHWQTILPQLGLDKRYLTGKHGPCPFCGGKDRWRFTDFRNQGGWICNRCGHGNGIDLAKRLLKAEYVDVAKRVESLIGTAPPVFRKERKPARYLIDKVWGQGRPISYGDAAQRYLTKRGLCYNSEALRFSRKLVYDSRRENLCGMLALITGPDGKPVNIQRTYLAPNGDKADLPIVRKMLGSGIPKGSAVRLAPIGEVLGIAEGVETALAASALFDVPVWATLGTWRMVSFEVPQGVKRVIIYADHDRNYAGQAAAYELAERLTKEKFEVDVQVPPDVGEDWNDQLLRLPSDLRNYAPAAQEQT